MSASKARVLIVGGGIGGMSAAIMLSRIGARAELIDLDPEWRVYGAGITITGPTLRAFKTLGVLEAIAKYAYMGEGIQICDREGHALERLPTALPGDEVPGSGGIMRPILHKILAEEVRRRQIPVRLGLSISALSESDEHVEVGFTDGTVARFDLLIGADGLFSTVRRLIRPDAPSPSYTGQSIWRVVLPRQVDCRHYFLGGPVKVGLNPVSREEMYLFLLENGPKRQPLLPRELAETLRSLLEGYGGVLANARERLKPDSAIVLRPLEAFLLERPWHLRRTLLIGDAAHPTTPQLASGAGMAVEDAIVLSQEMERRDSIEAVLAAFMERRYERCHLVARNSLAIGELEKSRAPIQAQTRIVEESLKVLAQPI